MRLRQKKNGFLMYKNACCGFYRSEHLYTNRRQDFQNILEIDYAVALDICYMFIEHGIKRNVDSAYGVCIY